VSNYLRLPGQLGAKAPDFSRPHLLLSAHLDPTAVAPTAAPLADWLAYWRKTGVGGHKIVAYARVDHTKLDHIQAAIDLFGAVAVGVQLPAIAQEQFANGQPWDVVANDGGIEGGHAIHLGAYDADKKLFGATTWGAVQLITFAWAQTYVTEVWAPITQDWIEANGSTPGGLVAFALGEDFSALTGEPNPFRRPNPNPIPGPPPAPAPAPPGPPVVNPDQALAVAARTWLNAGPHHSRADRRLTGELHAWLAETGL
jgi:hypothetical protein